MAQAGFAKQGMTQARLALALPLPCVAPALALPCSLSFSLNEESLCIVYIERRDSRDKARYDTGRVCFALALPCHCLALPIASALPFLALSISF